MTESYCRAKVSFFIAVVLGVDLGVALMVGLIIFGAYFIRLLEFDWFWIWTKDLERWGFGENFECCF